MSASIENKVTGKWDDLPTADESFVACDLFKRGVGISIDQIRQLNKTDLDARLSPEARRVLGDEPKIIFENQNGDKYHVNKQNNVTEFTYVDKTGNETFSFHDIKYGKDGKATSFSDSEGNHWQKQTPDSKSPFASQREGGGWMKTNAETGERSGSPLDLGDVTFDKTGVHATGINANYLGRSIKRSLPDAVQGVSADSRR